MLSCPGSEESKNWVLGPLQQGHFILWTITSKKVDARGWVTCGSSGRGRSELIKNVSFPASLDKIEWNWRQVFPQLQITLLILHITQPNPRLLLIECWCWIYYGWKVVIFIVQLIIVFHPHIPWRARFKTFWGWALWKSTCQNPPSGKNYISKLCLFVNH